MTINAKCMLEIQLTLSGLYPSSRDFSIAERTLTKIDFQLKLIEYYYLFRNIYRDCSDISANLYKTNY